MSELFQCDDKEALVAFLYGECRPDERDVIASHVARCVACAREVGALSATRKDLAAWISPAAPRAVHFGPDEAFEPNRGLAPLAPPATFPPRDDPRPRAVAAPWWRQPLPGWAQVAAAALLFAAGLAAGTARGTGTAPPATTVSAGPTPVSREELGSLAQALRAEIAQSRAVASPQRSSTEDAVPLRRVEALIAASEERQRRELALRTVQVVRDFDLQRRADLIQMQQAIGQFQGAAGAEVRQHRDAIEDLIRRVSQTGR